MAPHPPAEPARAETVAPAAAAAASLKSPEKWKVLQMLPEKHRRLFINFRSYESKRLDL